MNIPAKLTDYEAYSDDKRLIGITTVTLPSLEYLTDTIKGPGILGEMDMPTFGMPGSMACEIEWRTIHEDFTKYVQNKRGVTFEFWGNNQEYNAGSHQWNNVGVRVAVAGVIKKAEFGNMEVSAESGSKITVELYRLKVSINGKEKLHIDKFSKVYAVDGEDLYAEVRKNLGL